MKIEEIAYNRGYRVNKDGKLFSPKGKEIGNKNYTDYRYTNIRVNGKSCKLRIHRLQAYQKYGKKMYESNILVRHLNGDSTDNSFNNIKIGTPSQNMMDIPKDIRMRRAYYASSFIKKYDRKLVKSFYDKCKSYKKTMLHFNISSKGTLWHILNK